MTDKRTMTLRFVINVPVVVTDGPKPYVHLGGVAEVATAEFVRLIGEVCMPDRRFRVSPKAATLTFEATAQSEEVVEGLRELAKTKWWAKEELERRGGVVELEPPE